jgi:hypothetical protein
VVSNATGLVFYLNTSTANATEAEEACKRNGGHLAAFTSLEEQREVEQHYITNGFLFPKWATCHSPPASPPPSATLHPTHTPSLPGRTK